MLGRKFLFAGSGILFLAGIFYLYFHAPQKKADFSFALIGEQRTVDPALTTTLQESRIVRALFEGLVRLDPKTLSPCPGVAKSWEMSADGLIYIFHLRPCLWSDGSPVKAQDFVWSWERVLNPSSLAQYDYMLFYLKHGEKYRKGILNCFDSVGVKAENDSTLIVTLEHPTAFFLDLAAFETYMPVKSSCIKRYGIQWTRPGNIITNGAYNLTFHQLNYKMRLSKSPTYWDSSRAKLKVIDAFTCEGVNTAFNMYETGDVSLIDDYPNIIAEEILKRPDQKSTLCFGTYFYRMNVKQPPFSDYRVRRAFEMAINKDEIVRFVTKGGEVAARSLVPPGVNGYPQIAGTSYNPDSARLLLAQAGYPNGQGIKAIDLIYNTSENHKKLAEAVAFMLKKELNITVRPLNMEWKVLLSQVEQLDYTFARGSWYGDYTDPNTFLDMFVTNGGNNNTGWSDPLYDSLIFSAGTILDPSKRMATLSQAEALLAAQGPLIPIYYYVTKFLVKPDIRGLYPNIRGYFNLADLYKE